MLQYPLRVGSQEGLTNSEDVPPTQADEIIHEEASTIQDVPGYICRSLRHKLKRSTHPTRKLEKADGVGLW